MRKLRNRLPELIKEREVKLGRALMQKEISDEAGIPQGTLSRYVNDNVNRYDREIIEKICNYFEIEVGDFLQLEPPLNGDGATKPAVEAGERSE